MNKLMVKFVFLVIGLGSCATPPTPLPPTLIPPTLTPTLPPVCQSLESQEVPSNLSEREVVSEMIAQMNAGDVAGAMAYFAEDARVYIIGVPPIGFEENRGKEAICRTLADFVNDNLEWEITILSAFNSPKGVLITSKSNIWLDFYRQLDVAPNKFFENIFIEDGKISEYSLTLNEEFFSQVKSRSYPRISLCAQNLQPIHLRQHLAQNLISYFQTTPVLMMVQRFGNLTQ